MRKAILAVLLAVWSASALALPKWCPQPLLGGCTVDEIKRYVEEHFDTSECSFFDTSAYTARLHCVRYAADMDHAFNFDAGFFGDTLVSGGVMSNLRDPETITMMRDLYYSLYRYANRTLGAPLPPLYNFEPNFVMWDKDSTTLSMNLRETRGIEYMTVTFSTIPR